MGVRYGNGNVMVVDSLKQMGDVASCLVASVMDMRKGDG